MLKRNKIKLFLIGFIAIAIAHSSNLALANISKTETSNLANIGREQTLDNSSSNNKTLILVKKSGGRSGGGSFKSKPSRSKRTSPTRSYERRKSTTSPSRSYNKYKDDLPNSSPSYNRRESDSPKYRNSNPSYYNRSSSSGKVNSILATILISIFLLIFFGVPSLLLFLVLRKVFKASFSSSGKAERKIAQERDNDRVTISLLQVALYSGSSNIQQDLSELSKSVDTSTDEGVIELMQESALILLRSDRDWTHVFADSFSLDIAKAEEEFDKLSLVERSKFSGESLSNVDGNIKTKQSRNDESEGVAAYVVVTLIVGTADDNPLFDKIHNSTELKEALLRLSSMREDYLMKFELLWTPQQQGEYLTDEELLMEYTKIMPL